MKDAADLPTIIFRPSIVGGVWKDGIPGWADSYQGISILIAMVLFLRIVVVLWALKYERINSQRVFAWAVLGISDLTIVSHNLR